MLEKEIKAIITEEQYKAAEAMFSWDWVKEQINSYYTDENGIMKKNGITFRVRTKDNLSSVQIKKHLKAENALHVCEESEFPIPLIPQKFESDDVLRMTGINVSVSLLGSLKTKRHSLIYTDGVEICLDKSEYLDCTDYEIEIEYADVVPDDLIERLNSIGITFDKKCAGKYSRFLNRFLNIISETKESRQ